MWYLPRCWAQMGAHRRLEPPLSSLAVLTWDELHLMPGMGSKKARDRLEMFAAAVGWAAAYTSFFMPSGRPAVV